MKNICRGVSEGQLENQTLKLSRRCNFAVLLAEVIHYEVPRIIEIHNYSSQNGISHRQ